MKVDEDDCASRVARCVALVSKKLRLATRVKRGDACLSLRRVQLMPPLAIASSIQRRTPSHPQGFWRTLR